MTTLDPFRLSITSFGSTEYVGPTSLNKHVVLSLSGNLSLASSEPVHRSFQADQESGEFNQVWTSPADFERWRQKQHQIYSIELLLSRTCARTSYLWKQFYKCEREGTGGKKHYEKKGPRQSQKIGSKQTGCTCQVMVEAYPGTDTLLGKYTDDHDHPIGALNVIYTRVSKNTKGKIREMLQQGIQPRKVVCNHHFAQGIG